MAGLPRPREPLHDELFAQLTGDSNQLGRDNRHKGLPTEHAADTYTQPTLQPLPPLPNDAPDFDDTIEHKLHPIYHTHQDALPRHTELTTAQR